MTLTVLYGIQGTGNGHLARARCLIPALRAVGVELKFLLSGRDQDQFKDNDLFEHYEYRKGLTMEIKSGKVHPLKTLVKNDNIQFLKDVVSLDLTDIDLVISDFEPVTAWAAKLRGKSCIAISHQSAFEHDIPRVKGFVFSKLVMKLFAPAKISLGVHWHHFNQPILPPIIEQHENKEVDSKLILVYMGFEKLEDVINFLLPFTHSRFMVFARVERGFSQGNICVNPISHDEFHKNLERCSGVICNTGFELSSECLQLGKKLLTKPIDGQYEQLCNAIALQSLGRATVMETLEQDKLAAWLKLGGHKPIDYPDVAQAVAEWLVETPRRPVSSLADSLWSSFENPYVYNEDFGDQISRELLC